MTDTLLTARLLRQPARRVARVVARSRLERVFQKAAPLMVREGESPAIANEDVHDFRVALRRLRTWMRACRTELDDTVRRRRRRQLRRLSRLAGRVRDFEVGAAWLHRAARGRDRRAAPAAERLATAWETGQHEALLALHAALIERWPRVGAKLGQELQRYLLDVNLDDPDTPRVMGSCMAAALRRHGDTLRAALIPLPATGDIPAIHRARIAAKHLRYLLESFDARTRSGQHALPVLAALQDALGELHDGQVLARRAAGRGAGRSRAALRAAARRRITIASRAARRAMQRAADSGLLAEVEELAVRCERASARIVA